MTMMYMDLLGKKCRDAVTGFTGVVTSMSYDLYGCIQAVLVPAVTKDGKRDDGMWFDCKRLTVLENKPVMAVPCFEELMRGAERGPAEKPSRRLV